MFLKVSKYDIYNYKLTNTLTLIGTSVAAHATSFYIPELKIAFDAGAIVSGQQPDNVLISHCHTDHCHYINYFGSSLKKPTYYVPQECVEYLENYLYSQKQLSKYHDKSLEKMNPDHLTIGVLEGEKIPIKKGKYNIEIFKCVHSVPSVGYGISEIRKKLKLEYIGQDVRNMDKSVIFYIKKVNLVCFLGDTNIKVFDNLSILEYPIVIVECTFLEKYELDNAHKKFHICWIELEPIVKSNPDTKFVLIHFSDKYENDYIEDFFNKLDIKNVLPWVNLNFRI